MSVKNTFSNGRTMTAGFYGGLRLTNRQAQIVEMTRNGRSRNQIAASFGIKPLSVYQCLASAATANGLTMPEFYKRADLPPVRLGRPSVKHVEPVPAPSPAFDRDDPLPGTRKGWRLTQDEAALQLALRFNGDISNAARWLDWGEGDCIEMIVIACRRYGLSATLPNFLSI